MLERDICGLGAEALASGHFLLLAGGRNAWFVLAEAKSELLVVGRAEAWQR